MSFRSDLRTAEMKLAARRIATEKEESAMRRGWLVRRPPNRCGKEAAAEEEEMELRRRRAARMSEAERIGDRSGGETVGESSTREQ